jgi:hypothetical protein
MSDSAFNSSSDAENVVQNNKAKRAVQYLLYSTEQQGEVLDRVDTKWKSYTLGGCERLRHGSPFIIKSDQHAGLDTLSPLHSAKPHELEDIPSLALW